MLVATELTGDRPWRGELYLAAVYDRALSAEEVSQNIKAGANWAAIDLAALLPHAANRKVDFVKDLQPLFRKHCYECHSAENEEGGLNQQYGRSGLWVCEKYTHVARLSWWRIAAKQPLRGTLQPRGHQA